MSEDPIKWVETGQRVEARYADEKAVHAVGRVIAYTDAPTVVIETDDGTHVSWRADLSVPVRPVEHVGLVKRLRLGAVYAKREARDGEDPWVYLYGGSGADAQRLTIGDDVADTADVIGVVPGTAAAEAQTPIAPWEPGPRPSVQVPNEPDGLPLPVRQKVADLLVSGDALAAVNTVANALGCSLSQGDRYVRDMPEWQTYLNHHGRTEVDPMEADRMRAMGFDKQPEVKISDENQALIRSVLLERQGEYFDLSNLYTEPLAGVVADIVYAAIVQDRLRGDR